MTETPLAYADRVRALRGYRTVSRLIADDDNVFLDPYSALVSERACIGTGNVFYPNIRIEADPDLRGAVLKGRGRATGVALARGHVINGDGDFATAAVEAQSVYHPRPRSAEV